MKTLYIIRHAKSSWADPDQPDADRPLNDRGKQDSPRMGKRLKEKQIQPDLLLSSTAKRAYSTAKRIGEVIGYSKDHIQTDRKLYHANEEQILDVVKSVKDKYSTIIIFGHNPGLTDFVNTITQESIDIDNVPTCGIVALSFDVDQWKNISWGEGKFIFFDYPKSRED